jgi:hypothetical protein
MCRTLNIYLIFLYIFCSKYFLSKNYRILKHVIGQTDEGIEVTGRQG